jgi:hypothetical protein
MGKNTLDISANEGSFRPSRLPWWNNGGKGRRRKITKVRKRVQENKFPFTEKIIEAMWRSRE